MIGTRHDRPAGAHLRVRETGGRGAGVRSLYVCLLAAAVCLSVGLSAGCSEPAPADEAQPSASVAAASDSPEADELQLIGPTLPPAAPPWIHAEYSNAVFIGSSTTEAFSYYNLLEGAHYLYGTGLTVETVMTKPMTGSSVPVIDELAGKDYNQVILSFGLNELGWPNVDVFRQMYANVIARVREYLPSAAIYIQSVLPVSMEASQRNRFGVNQNRINEFNAVLRDFAAEQNVGFLDVSSDLKGDDGYLPADASRDGIHPTAETCAVWAGILERKMEEILNAGTGSTPPPDLAQAIASAAAQQAARQAAEEEAARQAAEQAAAEEAARQAAEQAQEAAPAE